MRSPPKMVPDWVCTFMCITASAAVPGMLVAACFGVSLGLGVTATIGWFATSVARLAFETDRGSRSKPKGPNAA
jgi:hypothetical protein